MHFVVSNEKGFQLRKVLIFFDITGNESKKGKLEKGAKNSDLNNTLCFIWRNVSKLEIVLFVQFFSEITSDQLRSDSWQENLLFSFNGRAKKNVIETWLHSFFLEILFYHSFQKSKIVYQFFIVMIFIVLIRVANQSEKYKSLISRFFSKVSHS